jgi:hypothetical protein
VRVIFALYDPKPPLPRAELFPGHKSPLREGRLHKHRIIQLANSFCQALSYPNTKSKTRNKLPNSTQMLGSRTNLKRKSPDPVPYVVTPSTKRSSSSAMHAMPHTIHTALVSIVSLLDTGSAWNVQMMEHMPDLQTLQMPPIAQNRCQVDWHLGPKPAFAVLDKD